MGDSSVTDPSAPRFDSDDPGTVADDEARRPPAAPELQSGAHVGRYVILYRLGRGGMGVVYAAYDPQLDRKIAIKVMRDRGSRRDPKQSHGRMLKEAQVLAKLSHPNVVAIHDVGVIDGELFVAMDYLEGQTLRRWWQADERSIAAIVDAFRQAGAGLAAAHRAGVVHRDFKPDNAIIDREGRVHVLDFGLARLRGQSGAHPAVVRRSDGVIAPVSGHETDDGTKIGMQGTPAYMSPEQHLGEPAGPTADQFALCVSLFEALYGRLPFEGDDHADLALAVTSGKIREPPKSVQVPGWVRRVIDRGLAVDPQQRYPSMEVLLEELRPRPERRRWAWAAGAVAGLGAGSVWWYQQVGTETGPCATPDERLAGVWDEQARAAITTAFEASSRHHAARTRESVLRVLDGYAQTWTQAWQEACEATHVHREQSAELMDLRMACLQRGADELAALARLLADADDELVDRALTAAVALPELAPCSDALALRERSSLPDDPKVREQIAAERTRLARAAALEHAGKLDDARSISRRVVERARELDHAPLLAEALHQHGVIEEAAAEPEAASKSLRQAAIAAEMARDDLLLARIRVALVGVDGDRLGKLDQGHLWADLARGTLRRIGGHPELQAHLENDLAFVVEQQARPEAVLEHRRRALELASQSSTGGDLLQATLLANLAGTLAELGKFDEARQRAEQAHALWERTLGPDHLRTAIGLSTIGLVYDYEGNYEEALQWYQRAHDALERALGPGNLRSSEVLNNIAITAFRLGQHERGEQAFRRVLAIRRKALGDEHPDVASAYLNLGAALATLDRRDEALAYHEKALALRRKLFGDDSMAVADSLVGVANVLERSGRETEALALRKESLAIQERIYGRDHAELVVPLANLAYNRLLVDGLTAARADAERALDLAQRHELKDDVRAFARLVLARVLTAQRTERDRVRALYDRAAAELGDLPALTERRLMKEIAKAQRWPLP